MVETSTDKNEKIELGLGLSLNGRFGVDPKSSKNNLTTPVSSSISTFLKTSGFTPLMRTCSLPVEADEETRKRKEMQTLRRMEAKKKRSEKQRRENGFGGKLENNGRVDFLVNGANSKLGFSGHGFQPKPGFRNGFVGNADNRSDSGSGVVGEAYPLPLSQGSSASSSGTSEFESRTPPPAGMNRSTEAKSPQSVQFFSDKNEQKSIIWSGEPKSLRKTASADMTVNTRLNPSRSISETSSIVKNVLADMPCVEIYSTCQPTYNTIECALTCHTCHPTHSIIECALIPPLTALISPLTALIPPLTFTWFIIIINELAM